MDKTKLPSSDQFPELTELVESHLLSIRLLRAIEKLHNWIKTIEDVANRTPFGLTENDLKRINRYKKAAKKNFESYLILNNYLK
jgi:hypothetical protein